MHLILNPKFPNTKSQIPKGTSPEYRGKPTYLYFLGFGFWNLEFGIWILGFGAYFQMRKFTPSEV